MLATCCFYPVDLVRSFTYPKFGVMKWNGSSDTGQCSRVSNINNENEVSSCDEPATSVLFDGRTPALSSLEGNTWATQFMIMQASFDQSFELWFVITNLNLVKRAEIIALHCPEWGSQVSKIVFSVVSASSLTLAQHQHIFTIYNTIGTDVPCGTLLKICVPINPASVREPSVLVMQFQGTMSWVHLAEVTFFNSDSACPNYNVVPMGQRTGQSGT